MSDVEKPATVHFGQADDDGDVDHHPGPAEDHAYGDDDDDDDHTHASAEHDDEPPFSKKTGKKKASSTLFLTILIVFFLLVCSVGGYVVYRKMTKAKRMAAAESIEEVSQVSQPVTAVPQPLAPAEAPMSAVAPTSANTPTTAADVPNQTTNQANSATPGTDQLAPVTGTSSTATASVAAPVANVVVVVPNQKVAAVLPSNGKSTLKLDQGEAPLVSAANESMRRDINDIQAVVKNLSLQIDSIKADLHALSLQRANAPASSAASSSTTNDGQNQAVASVAPKKTLPAVHKVAVPVKRVVTVIVKTQEPKAAKAAPQEEIIYPPLSSNRCVTAIVNNLAYVTKRGSDGTESEQTVVVGDRIDGRTVMSVDSRAKQVALEGGQKITTNCGR